MLPYCSDCRPAPPSRRTTLAIGRPFDECVGCGAVVAQPRFHEWELLGPGAKLRLVARLTSLALIAAGGVAIVVSVTTRLVRGRLDGTVVLVGLAVGLVLGAAVVFSRLSRDVRRSRQRMSDPMYRARLMKFEMDSDG